MSLPSPSTSNCRRPVSLSPQEQDALDAPLMELAQKSGGDLRRLTYAFFSFLHRRTDFYMVPNELDVQDNVPLKMGFREGDAEKLLLASFRQFPLRRMPRMSNTNSDTAKSNDTQKAMRNTKNAVTSTEKITKKTTATEKGSQPIASVNNSTKEIEKKTESNSVPLDGKTKKPDVGEDDVRYSEDGKQIPTGNGGTCLSKGFKWTQTIHESSIAISVPEGTRGKDLKVSIKANYIQVQMKENSKILLEGHLKDKILPDESTWTLESAVLLLTLDKYAKNWWEVVFADEEEKDMVDTTLINTKRNISEYDDATQGMIRKILFDQRQERLGLPSSDDILGISPEIPPLPDGVEYIDKNTNLSPDKKE